MKTFDEDHRESNPGLHRLYVRYALETLAVLEDTLEELEGQSRWPASDFANDIRQKILHYVETKASWFDAAALRYAHADTSSFFADDMIIV